MWTQAVGSQNRSLRTIHVEEEDSDQSRDLCSATSSSKAQNSSRGAGIYSQVPAGCVL